MKKLGWSGKTSLTDLEMAGVAIAYNTGSYIPSKGLKQGYKPKKGKYYGEQYYDYLRLSASVPTPSDSAPIPTTAPAASVLPAPSPVMSTGKLYVVDVRESPLRLRSEPKIDKAHPEANVKTKLPDGHIVRAVNNKIVDGFREVETSLWGAHFKGWAYADYLKPSPEVDSVPVLTPAVAPADESGGVIAVYMPRKQGTLTKRTEFAGPHSLNEPNQPTRRAEGTFDERRSDLAKIIDWLNVEKATHLRYQPRNKLTFCNIYAHDYCYLAGAYLPRIFWTPGAIADLAVGKSVTPLYGNTIEEVRANGLFRWLRDFGLRFGWRQTGTLTKLQSEANQGAVGLIVARRKEDGLSGHIVMVAPETDAHSARRNAAGEVTAPLQSQAGATNFSYGTSKMDWWKDAKFAESAFWLHA